MAHLVACVSAHCSSVLIASNMTSDGLVFSAIPSPLSTWTPPVRVSEVYDAENREAMEAMFDAAIYMVGCIAYSFSEGEFEGMSASRVAVEHDRNDETQAYVVWLDEGQEISFEPGAPKPPFHHVGTIAVHTRLPSEKVLTGLARQILLALQKAHDSTKPIHCF